MRATPNSLAGRPLLTRRRAVAALAAAAALAASARALPGARPALGFAAKEHDRILEQVFFGKGQSAPLARKERFNLICDASYLCLDQFNNQASRKGETALSDLRQAGVGGLPESIDDIDYTAGGSNHRMYTHRGFDFNYKSCPGGDKANFQTRREILLQTTSRVLGLSASGSRCKAFARLVYCTHLLGDHLEAEQLKDTVLPAVIMPLKRANPSSSDAESDLFMKYGECARALFSSPSHAGNDSQENEAAGEDAAAEEGDGSVGTGWRCQEFSRALDELGEKARKLVAAEGGLGNPENYAGYHACAEELRDKLYECVPDMLKSKRYFRRAFWA